MKIASSIPNHTCLRGCELIIIILAGTLIGVLSVYTGFHIPQQVSVSAKSQQSTTYNLTITELMDTAWNSSVAQPQFSVLGSNGPVPASNIPLPEHTLIQLTIISYDTPTPGSTDQQGKVSGTVGGTIFMINGTTAMGTDVSQQWGRNVTSVPGSILAHTFSIPQLGINVPVVGGTIEVAYLYINQVGTFQWICLTPCGFGADGMAGAMSAPGWMDGKVTVY